MIDLNFLRKNREKVIDLLAKKDPSFDGQKLFALDEKVRQARLAVEQLRSQRNELAQQGKKGEVTQEFRDQARALTEKMHDEEKELSSLEEQFNNLYLSAPNLPSEDIPVGGKEANRVVKEVGQKPHFSFPVKNHLELGNALGWFDFKRAATITAANFALYKDEAVQIIYALTRLMLANNKEHGFSFVLPSAMVNEESLLVASNFPKFRDQVYHVSQDQLYLTPTAEVNLANLYRNELLATDQLPIRMTAWTSCFRREAGNYGALERGLIRIHQFEKVELYTICEPENSADELDRMVSCAETILQKLELPYRISLLAGQDCSFASTKTYDIEVWLPGQKSYYEVSSCSNCTDFQARRGMIRYKTKNGDNRLVHTLNGSSLAIPRLMVALMEVYQQGDGSIAIPDILKKLYL